MRRKRHHTWSKIIERLEVKPQVMQHHVQPSVWASSVASSTTCLIIVYVSKVSMIMLLRMNSNDLILEVQVL